MENFDFTQICKSCAIPTKNITMYCFRCNHDPTLVQYKHINSKFVQCKLKTVKEKCIYHNRIELAPAQLLIEQKKVLLKNPNVIQVVAKPKPNIQLKNQSKQLKYEFIDSDNEN